MTRLVVISCLLLVFQARAQNAEAIAALESYAFTLEGRDEERKGIRTDAVVILRDGAVVYEKYARGFTEKKRHLAWSVSKSHLNVLVGAAVKENLLTVEDSVCQHLPKLSPSVCVIKIKHLLSFTSGLDWQETYENQSHQASSVLAMLYGQGQGDMVGFVASHALVHAPGQHFAYSSGDSMLLSGVLRAATAKTWAHRLPLFETLGMESVVWEEDGKGVRVGSSYLYATPRDLARFGDFLLNDGVWKGARLLPEGWLKTSTTPTKASLRHSNSPTEGVQGWHFWLNSKGIWKDVPKEAYAALGHWGQSVTVIPSMNLVVVRVADDRQPGFTLNEFLRLALAVGQTP